MDRSRGMRTMLSCEEKERERESNTKTSVDTFSLAKLLYDKKR